MVTKLSWESMEALGVTAHKKKVFNYQNLTANIIWWWQFFHPTAPMQWNRLLVRNVSSNFLPRCVGASAHAHVRDETWTKWVPTPAAGVQPQWSSVSMQLRGNVVSEQDKLQERELNYWEKNLPLPVMSPFQAAIYQTGYKPMDLLHTDCILDLAQ